MSQEERPLSGEAVGIAAFTLLQALIEKLATQNIMSQQDVRDIVNQSIAANLHLFQQAHGRLNHDAADLLRQVLQRVESGWPHRPATEDSQ